MSGINWPAAILWFLGSFLFSRFVTETKGPKPNVDPAYIAVIVLWPIWMIGSFVSRVVMGT